MGPLAISACRFSVGPTTPLFASSRTSFDSRFLNDLMDLSAQVDIPLPKAERQRIVGRLIPVIKEHVNNELAKKMKSQGHRAFLRLTRGERRALKRAINGENAPRVMDLRRAFELLVAPFGIDLKPIEEL